MKPYVADGALFFLEDERARVRERLVGGGGGYWRREFKYHVLCRGQR